jgi:hypothetical protein
VVADYASNTNYANWIQRCGRAWTAGLLASGFEVLTGTARKEHCGLLFLVAGVELIIILGIVLDNAQTESVPASASASAHEQGGVSKEKAASDQQGVASKEKEVAADQRGVSSKEKEKEKPKSQ